MNVVGYETANNKKPFTIPAPEKETAKKGNSDDLLEDMDEALAEYMKRRMTVLMQAQS